VIDVGAEDTVAARRQAKEERDSATDGEASEEAVPEIVGDKKAKVYYLTTCPVAVPISEVNRVLFKSAEDAEKAGFKLAKGCH
jgi:methylphosphotriester-DNA--protein-cysteine methyltransferase